MRSSVPLCLQTVQDAQSLLAETPEADGAAPSDEASASAEALRGGFHDAMSDDLNTPKAVAALSEPLKLMNDLMHTKKVKLVAGGFCSEPCLV